MKWAALFLIVSGAVFAFTPAICNAQYISFKQTFWGTYQYTKNGVDFEGFGSGWKNLLAETESVKEAHEYIRQSRNDHYIGNGLKAGWVILGIATYKDYHYEEVEKRYWLIGAGMAITSIICELLSRHRLDKGLRIYNKRVNENLSDRRPVERLGFGYKRNTLLIYYNF